MKKLIIAILFVFVLCNFNYVEASILATTAQECQGGQYSLFSLEDVDNADTEGEITELLETKTDTYLYGKHRLWVSLSRTQNLTVNHENYFYILLIDGYVWAEGKHNSTTWFSTKGVEFSIILNDADSLFCTTSKDGIPYMNDDYISYGDTNNEDIVLNNSNTSEKTQHVVTLPNQYNVNSIYNSSVLGRVSHTNNSISLDEFQKRKLVISYTYDGYNNNRTLPCAGIFHQCVALIFTSNKNFASVTVNMNATFFKDKKLLSNYTYKSENVSITKSFNC